MIAWSLAAVSILFGWLTLWTFRRTTDLVAFRQARNRLFAHLLEFRLFYDDPALIWRAQKGVVRENLRLLALLAKPVLIMTLPMAWLLVQLETVYGYAPLAIGKPTVVTAQMTNELIPADAGATLEGSREISVETPAVRSLTDWQISWRIRPVRPVCGGLRLKIRGAEIGKTICAGTRGVFLSRRCVRSLVSFLLRPEEGRLPRGDVSWVEIDYPEADMTIAGVALPWIAWFVLISILSAAAFARWSRVPL